MARKRKLKVLVVDDSALFRALLTEILDSDPTIRVVGAAEHPYEAREMIKKLKIYAGEEHPHEAQNPQTIEI